jgi:uncharacterized protein
MFYETKSISAKGAIQDVDTKSGKIIGYFSKFGNKDSHADIIVPGAFSKSLKENYRRLKHLYQHDTMRPLSSTKNDMLIVKEDKDGLHFESTISQTSWGKDVIQLHQDEVIDECSIGFEVVKASHKKTHRELSELKLWEGSSVTWGANEQAQTIKSFFDIGKQGVLEKMETVRNGRFENEEIFESLEIYFIQLKQIFWELQNTQPVEKTVEPFSDQAAWDELKSINKHLTGYFASR